MWTIISVAFISAVLAFGFGFVVAALLAASKASDAEPIDKRLADMHDYAIDEYRRRQEAEKESRRLRAELHTLREGSSCVECSKSVAMM